MPVLDINVTINNNDEKLTYKTRAILQDDCLSYKEKDNTLTKWYYNKNELVRDNDKLFMQYHFNEKMKTKGIIHIKEYNKNMDVEITTKKYKKKKNSIEIEYKIENNLFLYRIEEII